MNFVFLLGIVTGMRTMTGIAVVCWAAWLGWLPERGWALWTTYLVSALVFTGFALGEYIGDTRPNTPSRKDLGPAAARVAFGALVGAVVAAAIQQPVAGGIITGVVGALVGTWGGYAFRMWGARLTKSDLPVAIAESALALGLAGFAVWKLHVGILIDLQRGAF